MRARPAADPVGQRRALDDAAAAECERPAELPYRRGDPQLDDLLRRSPRVDVEPDEADERAGLRGLGRERLLPVADAGAVPVGGAEDRQVAVREPGEAEAGNARAVALASLRPDEHGQPPPADALGDHLAAVGDVQRDRAGAACAAGLAEGEVVRAGLRQRALLRRPRVEEGRQQALRGRVARPVGRTQKLVAPDVVVRPESARDPVRVRRGRARRRARRRLGRRPFRASADDRDGRDERCNREHRTHRGIDIWPRP